MGDRISEDKKKKERAVNFTANEVDLLANLLIQHADVIESKKTDATTWKQKEKEWEKVAEEFNSRSPHCPRSLKSLQMKYQAVKKEIKKKYASHKQQLYKTGGGEAPKTEFTPVEEKLLAILSVAVEGLSSRHDSDQISTPSASIQCLPDLENMEVVFADATTEVELGDSVNPIPEEMPDVVQAPEIVAQTALAESGPSNWANWNPTQLRKPLSAKLQTPSKKRKLTETKHDAIEKVSKLSTSKLELIELQKKSIEIDIENKQKKAAIELEILNMELEIKKVEHQIKLSQLVNISNN